MKYIKYKKGYKYQLIEDYKVKIPIKPKINIITTFIILRRNGELTIDRHYCWDGPSSIAIDTKNFMRPSLVHDALYQLMREQYLNGEIYRKVADKLLRQMCLEDGMSKIRAWWIYRGVRLGAGFAADPSNKRKIIIAPKVKS